VPCPLAGETLVIHDASLVAVHAHSGAVVTVTVPAPPAGSIVACANVSETAHLTGVGPVATLVVVELQPRIATRARERDREKRQGRTDRKQVELEYTTFLE
jgi:hypothetical protein